MVALDLSENAGVANLSLTEVAHTVRSLSLLAGLKLALTCWHCNTQSEFCGLNTESRGRGVTTPALYSVGYSFKFRPRLMFFVPFLSLAWQVTGQCLKLSHARILPYPLKFIIN
jgi:hypothetical protein